MLFKIESKGKEIVISEVSTLWRKIQYLLKLKTQLISFIFGFRYQIYGKNKNNRFKSEAYLEPVKSASAVPSV